MSRRSRRPRRGKCKKKKKTFLSSSCRALLRAVESFVRNCTYVPVKQVNWAPRRSRRRDSCRVRARRCWEPCVSIRTFRTCWRILTHADRKRKRDSRRVRAGWCWEPSLQRRECGRRLASTKVQILTQLLVQMYEYWRSYCLARRECGRRCSVYLFC